MPRYEPDARKTFSWNLGFMGAVANGATWQQATDAAWDYWRKVMSPKASAIYDAAIQNGTSAAWAAFWCNCPCNVPRPVQKASAADADGVTLESGRRIDWRIAKIKLQNKELTLSANQSALMSR